MTREQVAIMMLQGKVDLLFGNEDRQVEMIQNALDFADLFLDMSIDKNEWEN